MTCYEHLRVLRQKQINISRKPPNRLDGYLKAVENNKEVEYHKHHGRG